MRSRTRRFARLVLGLAWSVAVFPGMEISRAQSCSSYNNQGPYYELHCYYGGDCDLHDEDLVCQEEDCSNCLHQPTGVSAFCVEQYDCGSIPGCSQIVCT